MSDIQACAPFLITPPADYPFREGADLRPFCKLTDYDADRSEAYEALFPAEHDLEDSAPVLAPQTLPLVYVDCSSDSRPWMRNGRLYVGHPVGLAALGVVIPDISIMLRHPAERATALRAIADSGVDIFWSDPYAADKFEGDRVWVISRTGKVAPLWTHPEWKEWRGMPCGEIWATLGEDWVDAIADTFAVARSPLWMG